MLEKYKVGLLFRLELLMYRGHLLPCKRVKSEDWIPLFATLYSEGNRGEEITSKARTWKYNWKIGSSVSVVLVHPQVRSMKHLAWGSR